MNRFLLPLGIFVLLAIVLGVAVKHSPEKGVIPSALIGKAAPEFTLPVLTDSNQTFRSEKLKGQWYVLNVWGTWCYACRDEHAALLQIQKLGQVPLIGLDWKDADNDALQYLAQQGNPYDVVAADREGRTAIDWGVYGAPESFLVNPQGIVVYKFVGPLTLEAWEAEFVPRMKAQQQAASS